MDVLARTDAALGSWFNKLNSPKAEPEMSCANSLCLLIEWRKILDFASFNLSLSNS